MYKKYWAKKALEGATSHPQGWGAPPALWATWKAPGAHILLYEGFCPGKNEEEAFGMKRHRLEAEPGETNLGLRRSVLPGKHPSGRGKSSPSILSLGGGQSPSTSSPAPSPLKL